MLHCCSSTGHRCQVESLDVWRHLYPGERPPFAIRCSIIIYCSVLVVYRYLIVKCEDLLRTLFFLIDQFHATHKCYFLPLCHTSDN